MPSIADDRVVDGVAGESAPRADLRMPALAVAAWTGGLAALTLAPALAAVLVAVLSVGGLVAARRRPGALRVVAAGALVAAGVLASAVLRTGAVEQSPVADLAADRAVVELVGVVVSDPRVVSGPFGDQAVVRLDVREVVGRGHLHRMSVPVVALGDVAWLEQPLGATVHTRGRLVESDGRPGEVAGVLTSADAPTRGAGRAGGGRGAGAVGASSRAGGAHRPADPGGVGPARVDGDDAGLAPDLEEDFRTTGLTHLTAVSGTNLTLVVGFLLVLARWCHVRGRWLVLVAALGIVGFVLLARTEPSVVRAAAMGTVGLIAMGANGRRRATRGLAVAVVALLLVQPALAVSVGFALSVLATAGIVLLAPGWRDVMAGWMPRWLAEAVAVPAAAQLACTPVVAAISGQVSLVAVVANLLVAPAVGPATVLGLGGGLVGLVSDPGGRLLGIGAGWCVGWIVLVARVGADLPVAALEWGTGPWSLALLTLACVAMAFGAPAVLRSARLTLPLVVLLAVVMVVPLPRLGWPAAGWVVVACDVGQGDALVLRSGPGAAVVVDAGPDPAAIDGCLDRLGVEVVPLVVLTHFHADHVDGLPGVTAGREVGQVWTTSLLDPPPAVDDVLATSAAADVAPTLPAQGTRSFGDVVVQPVWPLPGPPTAGPGDGSTANDASVVLVAEVRGVRILLTGDVEPPGQAAIAAEVPGLAVDVLKVPHHGSRYQDLAWLTSLRASIALVSVGADNDYGHPAPDVVQALEDAGADVHRTDEEGDVLVRVSAGTTSVVSAR